MDCGVRVGLPRGRRASDAEGAGELCVERHDEPNSLGQGNSSKGEMISSRLDGERFMGERKLEAQRSVTLFVAATGVWG